MLSKRKEMGRPFSIVVVAEDARPHQDNDFLTDEQKQRIYREEHLGGIGHFVGREIEKRTTLPARVAVLGYIQRGGSPTAYDRVLATRMGVYAVEMVVRGEFGRMAALQGTKIGSVPLEEVADRLKTVSQDIYQTAEIFFG
jgi:6-phosphofructokinase 1